MYLLTSAVHDEKQMKDIALTSIFIHSLDASKFFPLSIYTYQVAPFAKGFFSWNQKDLIVHLLNK